MASDDPMKCTIPEFLEKFWEALRLFRLFWVDRQNTDSDLVDLGITRKQAENELKILSTDCHHRGPEEDKNEPKATVHIFKHQLSGTSIDVYVKISLRLAKGNYLPKLWSFKRWK